MILSCRSSVLQAKNYYPINRRFLPVDKPGSKVRSYLNLKKHSGEINFDIVINRENANSLKYDFHLEHGKSKDLLLLWIASDTMFGPKGKEFQCINIAYSKETLVKALHILGNKFDD